MSVRRTLALGTGLLAVAAGLVFVLQPGVAAGISVGEFVLLALGYGSILYAVNVVRVRRKSERRLADPPDPELVPEGEIPGADFDDVLAAAHGTSRRATDQRRRIRRHVERTAVDAIRYRHDCTEEAARERLADGTWTDDPLAAAYFTDGPVSFEEFPMRRRARLRIGGVNPSVAAARHAVAAAADLLDEEGPG